MPIEYQIDHERQLVLARAFGVITSQDVFGYQREVWSRADVVGYNELIDMSAVKHVVLASGQQVMELAWFSARMDTPSKRFRFAIVAPQDSAFALGRMYESYRNLDDRSVKQVAVFRTMAEGLAFLGITEEREG